MKNIWLAEWEIAPGNGVHTRRFPTLAEAKRAMRGIVADTLRLDKYIAWLREEEEVDCKDTAAFLEKYLTDPEFPLCAGDVPVDYEEPEHCDLYFSTGGLGWDYWYDACPRLHTNMVLDEIGNGDDYELHFWYEHPENLGDEDNLGLSIRIREKTVWGTSAYPLMVLRALSEMPRTQEQIIRTIFDMWDTVVDRKAVGRHLKLLADLGFPVTHSSKGYYCDGEPREPKAGVKFGTSAYPLMILQVLDGTPQTQPEIIQKVYGRFGTKIDRKAVCKHLNLLEALEFFVKKCKDGCYISR